MWLMIEQWSDWGVVERERKTKTTDGLWHHGDGPQREQSTWTLKQHATNDSQVTGI